ncbi:translational activator of cytochrome c oxidase 1-like [Asterias rubens]|uniref:translational activator of cytochrome c oxidase 1-like n=1 Tax=Asterias rubens TaxID=7604 RepID=UPI0014551604|nr:translational activator of cytochrome c oxidase 1-like [Asterias rubens]XP_033639942.1 translational activator of cytochrome c oxidase 1-like [Asterias rubens]XP_033639943.1 translational activator of cytochrome c oxidase 1-like [Asterias rubens]XP_033639944.1 translational activator of cytochrome c oxidase 1-like [Asterias rubens]
MAAVMRTSVHHKELSHLLQLCRITRCCVNQRNLQLASFSSSHHGKPKSLVNPSGKDTQKNSTIHSHCESHSQPTFKSILSEQILKVNSYKSRRMGSPFLGCAAVETNLDSRRTFPFCLSLTDGICRTQSVRCFHTSDEEWAGHNKWSKVRHIKGPKDELRSLQINKIVLQMRIAIREGGANPELNSVLGSLVTKAKAIPMPKATIEAVLKNATKKGGADDADIQLLLEARGPGQCCLLMDVLTDNARRSRSELQRLLQKNGGDFGTTLYAFNRKGVVRVVPQLEGQESPLTLDLATEVAIEVGAEDVQETANEDDEALFMFVCDMKDLRVVRNNLASLNYTIESSSLEYLSDTTTTLNDTNLQSAFELVSHLNNHPNVVKVYDNIEGTV